MVSAALVVDTPGLLPPLLHEAAVLTASAETTAAAAVLVALAVRRISRMPPMPLHAVACRCEVPADDSGSWPLFVISTSLASTPTSPTQTAGRIRRALIQ